MGEARRLIKNTGIIAVGGMATKLVQFLLLPLYTTVLAPAEYGAVDYLNTIALFCVPVASLLMDEALFRFLIDCKTEEDRRRAVTATIGVLAVGCVLFAVLMGVLELVFHPESFWWIVALVYAGVLLQVVSALLRGFGDTTGYALANFLASAIMIVLNVLFIAVLRWGVSGMLAATVIAQGGVALVFAARKRVWRFVDLRAIDRAFMGRLIRYSVPLIPNKVSWTIMNMLDRLVIMMAIGPAAAGLYAVAYKFPNVMDQIYGFFYQSWKESSARALNSSEDEVSFYNRIYRALRRLMMSVVLGMTALMPFIYDLLIDWQYHEGILYVPILLLATYLSNISGFYGGIFTAHKDTRIMGTTTIVSALACLVLNLLLIRHGFNTSEIAIGNNLLIFDWISDLVRLNKSFIVKRDVGVRQMLEAARQLSGYIHFAITQKKESVWIAQREGRSKDSDDRTQESLIKMLGLAGDGNLIDNLKEINLVPVSISYEYDPCDYLKAQEFLLRRDNPDFKKSQEDDLHSMEIGLLGYKGRVHFEISPCINDELDKLTHIEEKSEILAQILKIIDKGIHSGYMIYPGNYIAYDMLNGTDRFADRYTHKESLTFTNYLHSQLAKIPDADELTDLFVAIGAKHSLEELGIDASLGREVLAISAAIRNRLTLCRMERLISGCGI